MSRDTNEVPDVVQRSLHALTHDTPVMAKECQGPDGTKVCFVCGAPATVLVAPGWGGVWACRTCDVDTAPP